MHALHFRSGNRLPSRAFYLSKRYRVHSRDPELLSSGVTTFVVLCLLYHLRVPPIAISILHPLSHYLSSPFLSLSPSLSLPLPPSLSSLSQVTLCLMTGINLVYILPNWESLDISTVTKAAFYSAVLERLNCRRKSVCVQLTIS